MTMEKLTRKTCNTWYVCDCCAHQSASQAAYFGDFEEYERSCAKCIGKSKFVNSKYLRMKYKRWLRKKGKIKVPFRMKNLACRHRYNIMNKELPF